MRDIHMSPAPAHVGNQGGWEAIWGFVTKNADTLDHIASGLSSLVTAVAVFIGGIWAYRKFVRGRTFKPRSAPKASAQWHVLPGVGHVLQVRISVTNIGATNINLIQRDTGLTISFPAAVQSTAAHRRNDPWWANVRWDPVAQLEGGDQPRTFAILKKHQWIEPGETVFDDLLLNLGRDPTIALVKADLCWRVPRWWWKDGTVCDYLTQIIPPQKIIDDNHQDNGEHDETGGATDGC